MATSALGLHERDGCDEFFELYTTKEFDALMPGGKIDGFINVSLRNLAGMMLGIMYFCNMC